MHCAIEVGFYQNHLGENKAFPGIIDGIKTMGSLSFVLFHVSCSAEKLLRRGKSRTGKWIKTNRKIWEYHWLWSTLHLWDSGLPPSSFSAPFSLLPVLNCKNCMMSFCCLRDFLTKSVEVSCVLSLVSYLVVAGEPQKIQIADVDQISSEVIYSNWTSWVCSLVLPPSGCVENTSKPLFWYFCPDIWDTLGGLMLANLSDG